MKEFKVANHKGWFIENLGIYKGHLYAVTFSATNAFRCGYVLLNEEDDCSLDEYDDIVQVHGGVTLMNDDASHLFQNSDLMSNHRLIGWDYGHLYDGYDTDTVKQYLAEHPDDVDVSISVRSQMTYWLEDGYDAASEAQVIEDCISAIDDIIYHQETGEYRRENDDEEE